jgi:predicted phosphodiesterase
VNKKIKRRSFLALGATAAGVTAYSMHRGLRMPPLRWEPRAPRDHFLLPWGRIKADGLIKSQTELSASTDYTLRAFIPEPEISLRAKQEHLATITVTNIAPDAELLLDPVALKKVDEVRSGITRTIRAKLSPDSSVNLKWQLPPQEPYRFAAIGDTGGGLELEWCIQRAAQLKAKFLLHLGDFNYQQGDYANTIRLLNQAPLPCYVAIGNHDFHDEVTDFPQFLENIGPLNSHFVIGNTRFANIDTGASFLPASGGLRGDLFTQLAQDTTPYASNIAFTHRPLFDPIEGSDHDIGNNRERNWLIKALQDNNFDTLLSGHIHIHARDSIGGIDNIIVGQGLGHQDLITDSDYSKMAIGKVDEKGHTSFEFAPLAMPMELHCHPRNDVVKESLVDAPHADKIRAIDAACQRTSET